MAVPFDHIASVYESVLSRSAMGQLQRKEVWKYLENVIPHLEGLEMLELNWGSNEDAMMFSDKGYNIIATDVSIEMAKVTQEKAHPYSSVHNRISSQYLDLDCVNEILLDKKYDLIFSNFGGLNCISPESLKKFFAKLPTLLNPNGRFIGVIMTRFCLTESFYHLLKFQFRKAFRRWSSKEVSVTIQDNTLKTWYYRPSTLQKWSASYFNIVNVIPVGVVIPPMHLSSFFLRKKGMLLRLTNLENMLSKNSFCAEVSDHFILDLQVRN